MKLFLRDIYKQSNLKSTIWCIYTVYTDVTINLQTNPKWIDLDFKNVITITIY